MFRVIGFFILALVVQVSPQSAARYNVFDAKGGASSLDAIVRSADRADVLFLGELHDDSVGHAVQLEIFQKLVDRHIGKRPVVLSLEMFERDVQIVLDEYLSGLISESHFLLSSRPWGNYKTDYRPLIELAKEKKLPVIAANAPRRYVNMVSRNGRDALNALSPQAKSWLAPLPYDEASEAYAKKFRALMGASMEASMGLDNILKSQALWDATMAHSISEALNRHKGALIVHLNGGFHSESRLGAVEHLTRYRPASRSIVVTARYETDFANFHAARHSDLGDFVVLTDASAPRSR